MKQSHPHQWWQRALSDGKHCAMRGRERYYSEYLSAAEESLLPGPLTGPFLLLYRMGFRLGFDNEKLRYSRELQYFSRPKKKR